MLSPNHLTNCNLKPKLRSYFNGGFQKTSAFTKDYTDIKNKITAHSIKRPIIMHWRLAKKPMGTAPKSVAKVVSAKVASEKDIYKGIKIPRPKAVGADVDKIATAKYVERVALENSANKVAKKSNDERNLQSR